MPRAAPRAAASHIVVLALACIECAVAEEGVPPGKLAVVGEVALGPEDLESVGSQLGAYAHLRFAGEGRSALLSALVAAELLAQEAVEHGLRDDPRVMWAQHEESATLFLNAELERRVPRASVAADEAALLAHYEANIAAFTIGERRRMTGVVYRNYTDAEVAHALLQAGIVQLAWLGEPVTTQLQTRDDAEYPGFHPILFDTALAPGDPLPTPVLVGEVLVVGSLDAIEPAAPEPFDDPAVRERLVQAVRAPLVRAAEDELLRELAERYPEHP